MSLKYMSISQLAEVTGLDRRTVATYLKGITPTIDKPNEKRYYAKYAIPLLLSQSGKVNVGWTHVVRDWLNSIQIKSKD